MPVHRVRGGIPPWALKRNARLAAGVVLNTEALEDYFSALNRSRCGPASSPRRRFLSSSYSR